jgi:hypothetical protein
VAVRQKDPVNMLLDGEVDAAILGMNMPKDQRVRTLIPDPHEAALQWYGREQLVPPNHYIIVPDALCEQRPDVVREVWRMLVGSRRQAKSDSDIDAWPVGIEANRKALECAIKYATIFSTRSCARLRRNPAKQRRDRDWFVERIGKRVVRAQRGCRGLAEVSATAYFACTRRCQVAGVTRCMSAARRGSPSGNSGKIEVPRGVADHAEPPHHSQRAVIVAVGKRHDLGESEHAEAVVEPGAGGLGRVALAPKCPLQPPADFDAGAEG